MLANSSCKETTWESLYPLGGKFRQPKQGNRFGMEALALAYFPTLTQGMRVMDLGTGSGIIPVILARRQSGLEIHAVEMQPLLASLAASNMAVNGFAANFTLHQNKICSLMSKVDLAETFDLVVANPPFFARSRARMSSDNADNLARFTHLGDFAHWVSAAAFLLQRGGRFCVVLPRSRFLRSCRTIQKHGFRPVRLSWIYPKTKTSPRFFLLESAYQTGVCRLNISPHVYP